jgi:CheY-like chemotaxis protein
MMKQQEAASLTEAVDKKLILIVEDDGDTGFMLCSAIEENMPYQPLLVEGATEALQVVEERSPDLFLLDYYLPVMNGLELSDRLHRISGLQAVPTILMSAGTLPLSFEQEINAHQIVFLRKPFDLEEFFEVVERLLS